jgi:RNA polymerase sigma-70 factor (ECF subfamily)
MQPLPDERELIERARNGDKAAVGRLYEAYVQPIFEYIDYRVGSATIAEDLTADVFLRMVRALPAYHFTGAPFGAWLVRIAANRITDFYREKRVAVSDSILENYRSDEPDPYEQVTKTAERSHVRKAMQTLPEDYQTVLILRFTQELPHTEVASIMGKSIEAVRILQHRALKSLAKIMRQSDDTERSEG